MKTNYERYQTPQTIPSKLILLRVLVAAAMLLLPRQALAASYDLASGWLTAPSSSEQDGNVPLIAQALTPISKAQITIDTTCYDGSRQEPLPTVTYGGKTLAKNKDYQIIYYRSNTNAGTGVVMIGGMGSYSGSVIKTFGIERADISTAKITLEETNYAYTGAPVCPVPNKVTVSMSNGNVRTLNLGKDYTLSYENNTRAGSSATVTLTGVKNYQGAASASFYIGERVHLDPTEIDIRLSTRDYEFTGDRVTPIPTVYTGNTLLRLGVDYTVEYDERDAGASASSKDGVKCVNVGQWELIVNCMGKYEGSASTTYNIVPSSLVNSKNKLRPEYDIMLSESEFTYTGREHTPKVTVVGPAGTLVKGTDYDLTYSNNVHAGENDRTYGIATVKVTAKGNYTGEATATFVITGVDASALEGDELEESLNMQSSISDASFVRDSAYAEYATSGVTDTARHSINVMYTGKAQRPISVTYVDGLQRDASGNILYDSNGLPKTLTRVLEEGKDYGVTYSNNKEVGVATAIFYGMGQFTGREEVKFTISKIPMRLVTMKLSPTSCTYDFGNELKPAVSASYNKQVLSQGASGEYKIVEYKDNVNAGTGKVTVVGNGKHFLGAGELQLSEAEKAIYGSTDPAYRDLTFTIKPRTITDGTLTLSQSTYKYNAAAQKPVATLVVQGHTLELDKDYTLSYANNKEAGTATVTAKGIKNFTGKLTTTFTIVPAPIDDVTITVKAPTYTGEELRPTPTLKIGTATVAARNYTVAGYGNNINASAAAVILIDPHDSLTGDRVTQLFTINRRSIANGTAALSQEEYVYDGTAHKPTVTSLVVNNRTLTLTSEYKVSKYQNNVNASDPNDTSKDAATKARVVLTGVGNYRGTLYRYFTIRPLSLSDASITKKALATTTYDYGAVAREPQAVVERTQGNAVKSLLAGTDYTMKYANNIEAGTATATVTGKGNYTGSFTRNFTINSVPISRATITFADQKWTGSPITPAPTVRLGTATVPKTAYTVSNYTNNTNLTSKDSLATAKLTGAGSLTGSVVKSFNIVTKPIANATVQLSKTEYDFTGNAHEPTVKSVTLDGKTLRAGTDYSVSYSNNTYPSYTSQARATVTGIGTYSGTAVAYFTIKPIPLTGAKITLKTTSYTYDGTAHKPEVSTVTLDGRGTLDSSRDYDVKYSNNVNAGTATVTIKAKEGQMCMYGGSASTTFTINPQSITGRQITPTYKTYIYTHKEIKPSFSINGLTDLKNGTDYTATYANNINVGKATITVTGKGNYTGTTTGGFDVVPNNLSDRQEYLKIKMGNQEYAAGSSFEYTGAEMKPTLVISRYTGLKEGQDYTVSYSNNKNVGTARVTVTAKSGQSNCTGSSYIEFNITQLSLEDKTIDFDKSEYAYTGKAITPAVTLRSHPNLKAGVDYTVSYENNVVVSDQAKATVTGTGNCSGTTSGNFRIVGLTLADATIELSQSSFSYDGKEHKPEVKSVKTSGGKTLSPTTDYIVSYGSDDCVSPGEKSITVSGKGNYAGAKVVTYTIEPKSIEGATVSIDKSTWEFKGSNTACTPTVTEVRLSDGTKLSPGADYTVSYANNKSVGTQAQVVVTGVGNYKDSVKKKFTITQKSLSEAEITLSQSQWTYTGSVIEPTISSVQLEGYGTLTAGRDYKIKGCSNNTNAGAAASVTIEGMNNYTGTATKKFTIAKKSIAGAEVTLATDSYVTDGKTKREPKVTSVLLNGYEPLVLDTDFTVKYTNNVNEGWATVTITGKGNFEGSAEKQFKINGA